jgi:translation initiation factor IF-2
MRVHILAKELNVSSKTIIEKCKAEGITSVKNHMSTLSAGLHATICEWFSEGSLDTAVETAEHIDIEKVRIKRRRKAKEPSVTQAEESGAAATEPMAVTAAGVEDAEVAVAVLEPPTISVAAVAADEIVPVAAEVTPVEADGVPEAPTALLDEGAAGTPPTAAEAMPASAPPGQFVEAPTMAEAGVVSDLAAACAAPAIAAAAVTAEAPPMPREVVQPTVEVRPPRPVVPITPAGPQNIPAKAKLQGPRVVRYEPPGYDSMPERRRPPRARRGADAEPAAPAVPIGAPEPGRLGDRAVGRRKGRIPSRRVPGRPENAGEKVAEWGDRDLAERRERLAGVTGRRIHRRTVQVSGPTAQSAPTGPKTEATVREPVHMKELCAAAGLNFMQCFKILRDEHNILANVNMTLPTETAELLALHFGIDLKVIPSKTRFDELREEFAKRERLHLQARPPVVTMLGHVDHGKTSLLDAIRRTRVVAGEDGGITQHIGAYHLKTTRGAVTFLDTPGHEAFTAMRARGAQMTDVVVLVVAADDGVMPQTTEAINHAKAAGVPIVVALNKIDLGDQNKLKIYGQLTEQGLTPSGDWGGEVDVIPTSATSGRGVQELVEHLADLSSLLEFRADPTLPAAGTVIEAETKPGVGAVVTVLVQEGTLRVGDFVVCGGAYGKVRALLDDCGQRIPEAGPSLPVEVWGLDDVPTAGDKLYVLDSPQRAKDIATETKQTRIESSRVHSRKVRTLEEMFLRRDAQEVPELNVVIKADVDGSVSALHQSLGDFPTAEVRLAIRHAGVGPVNDSDVLLAATCEGIIVAFRVDVAVGVRRMAEQNGVEIRSYRVIYDVCDDIKKALEGLLAPEERIEPRGSAEVRQLFKLGKKAGMVAGTYVTGGTVDRSHFAKVLRDGVIVREGCKIASLRRFKDDVKEARAGLECGIRLDGFDDIHVGDLVETYEIMKIPRTL